AERHEPLGRRTAVFGEPDRLVLELTDLHAHLFAALEETLELTLDLLNGLTQIAESMVTRLNCFALGGLTRRQRRQFRPPNLLAIAQRRQLRVETLGLGRQRRPIRRDQRQRELALL